jgi:hypothetical protein
MERMDVVLDACTKQTASSHSVGINGLWGALKPFLPCMSRLHFGVINQTSAGNCEKMY